MLRKLLALLFATLAFLIVLAIGLWIRSYFVADYLEHVYEKPGGMPGHYSTVEGEPNWVPPPTLVTQYTLAGGRLSIDHPSLESAPAGWKHITERYSQLKLRSDSSPATNALGFLFTRDLIVLPMWAISLGLMLIPISAMVIQLTRRKIITAGQN